MVLRQVVWVILVSAIGCSKPVEFQRVEVTGTVTLNGQPLEEGTISIYPDVKVKGPLVQAKIVGGKFSLTKKEGPATGANRVSIKAVKKTGRKISSDGIESDEVLQYIPPQYNDDTTLKADVKPEPTKNEFVFELSGQVAPRNADGTSAGP